MCSGDGDSLTTTESVQRFLRDLVDQVISGAVENETDERRNLVQNVLDNVISKTVQTAQGRGNSKDRDSCINQDKSQKRNNPSTTHQATDKGPSVSMKSADHYVGENISKYSDNERKRSLNRGSEADEQIQQTDAADETTRFTSLIFGHASRGIIKDEIRQIMTTSGDNEATSGNITNCLLTRDNISDVSAFTDRLESLSNKYGRQQSQSIKSLQSEYIESVAYEKTDAKIRVRTGELKGKLFTPFPKLKNKKTRYGKVKIYHTVDLSADEQKRIVKEATELMKYLKKKEKEEKLIKRAAKEKKGIGARILGFFRNLSCCKASKDE